MPDKAYALFSVHWGKGGGYLKKLICVMMMVLMMVAMKEVVPNLGVESDAGEFSLYDYLN